MRVYVWKSYTTGELLRVGETEWQDVLISYWDLKKYIKILSEEKKIDTILKDEKGLKKGMKNMNL